MTQDIPTPQTIWIVTQETDILEISAGSRSSEDRGGWLSGDDIIREVPFIRREPVELAKLKREMKGFLQAMREMLDEADPPESKMCLDEVELTVEINGEGQVSLLGSGGKIGGKGAMTFKFKRRDG